MTTTIESIYEEFTAGSTGFIRAVSEMGYETDNEVIEAIAEIAPTAADFQRVWASPSAAEFEQVSRRALELSEGEVVLWGQEEISE